MDSPAPKDNSLNATIEKPNGAHIRGRFRLTFDRGCKRVVVVDRETGKAYQPKDTTTIEGVGPVTPFVLAKLNLLEDV